MFWTVSRAGTPLFEQDLRVCLEKDLITDLLLTFLFFTTNALSMFEEFPIWEEYPYKSRR